MERINSKDVQSMMEAYASVYKNEESESEILLEFEETDGGVETLAQKNARVQRENEKKLEALRRQRRFNNVRDDESGLTPKAANLPSDLKDTEQRATATGQRVAGKPMGGLPADYKKTELEAGRTAERSRTGAGLPRSGGGNQGQGSSKPSKPAQSPISNLKPGSPNVTKDGVKFERRTPTMAELRAAQAARRAAPKVLSRAEIEKRALKAAVGEGQRKPPTAPPPVSSTKPAVTPAAKPAVTAAGNKAAELAALRAKAKADTLKRTRSSATPAMSGRARMREELDVFDTIKEYLIGEGATEEEALKQMLTLTDEQRTEIIEGSCGSKPKKKKKGGYGK